jgi:hypothetical protein
MDKISAIKLAIENAEKCESKLDNDVMAIGGYTGTKLRHLLNNLGAISKNVWEIGSHRGSTICATMFKNENLENVYFSDDFSEFDDGTVRSELISNTARFTPANASLFFLEKDCFTTEREEVKVPIDLYLYDGNHSIEAQRNAFTKMKDFFADEFIAVVDDGNWQAVKDGTAFGVRDAGLEILFQKHLGIEKESDGEGYWNGTIVLLLKKKK